MALSCPFGTRMNLAFIDQACSIWIMTLLCAFMDLHFISAHNHADYNNKKTTWPISIYRLYILTRQAWSITHIDWTSRCLLLVSCKTCAWYAEGHGFDFHSEQVVLSLRFLVFKSVTSRKPGLLNTYSAEVWHKSRICWRNINCGKHCVVVLFLYIRHM